jgi:hypothetical protein
MTRHHAFDTVKSLERQILRVLCGGAITAVVWEALAGQISDHLWQEPEHRVVYEALRQIRSRDPQTLRDQIPAQATRMGFPDVEWAAYLSSQPDIETNPKQLIARLKAAATGPRRDA